MKYCRTSNVSAVEEAHPDQEGIGAGAAREAGRLRVEIEEPRAARRRLAPRQERQRRLAPSRAPRREAGGRGDGPRRSAGGHTSTRPSPSPRRRRPGDPRARPLRRKAGLVRLLASRRRMTRRRSEMASLTRGRTRQRRATSRLSRASATGLARRPTSFTGPTQEGQPAGHAQALERLEAAREQLGQHLEDALGEPDAARLIVVEVDRRGELVALHELGAHDLARDHLALGRGRAVAEPRADVADVAEEEDGRQRVEQARERAQPVHELVAMRRDLGEQRRSDGQPRRRRLHLLLRQLDLARADVLHRADLDLLEAHDLLGDEHLALLAPRAPGSPAA